MHNKTLEPLLLEKIIAGLSYLTMGVVGFIWLILGAILKLELRPFLKYHIYQQIFLSFIFLVLSLFSGILDIFSHIPFLGTLIIRVTFWLETPLIATYSVFNIICILFVSYLTLSAFAGKYTFIPWVSNIIKSNIDY